MNGVYDSLNVLERGDHGIKKGRDLYLKKKKPSVWISVIMVAIKQTASQGNVWL